MSETRDQQTRRRWVTLAEVVAVAGVVIAALSLWNSWQDRRDAAASKTQEQVASAADRRRFDLRGTVDKDRDAIDIVRDDAHPLTEIRVSFAPSLGIAPQDAVDHRIPADWFADPLRTRTDGGPDDQTGRLPVLVAYTYLVDDKPVAKRAIYDIVWRTHGRRFRGRAVELVDFRLREAGGSQARLDALFPRRP